MMQQHNKIILIFVIFVVGTIIISTINDVFALHAEDFITKQLKLELEESSLILTTGNVTTATDSYSISDNIEIRHIYPGEMMRISGTLDNGYPFYAIQKDSTVSGTLFTENGPQLVVSGPVHALVPGPGTSVENLVDSIQDQEVKAVVLIPHHTYWRQFLNVNVKVFDAAANPLNDYWFKSNLVANIPVLIEISHESGTHLGTIEGITDDNGYFQASQYITENLVRDGKYIVHLEIGDESNIQVQELNTFVRGEVVGSRDDKFNKTGLE